MTHKSLTWVVRIVGLAILAFLWYASYNNIPDWTDGHYENMNGPQSNYWNWVGLIMTTIGSLGIVMWYDLDKLVNEKRESRDKKPIHTMYFRTAQFLFVGIGFLLMAS